MLAFDRKFGEEFIGSVPNVPGVYRVFSAEGNLIYIGKAKNLRRRLRQYRNAKRRKKHFKMRAIVREADRIEFEICPSDLEACLLEARLIQELRPKWNVAGAFHFLYPMVGMKCDGGTFSFCFTTDPGATVFKDFEFHGAYRSRHFTGEAFFSLMKLLKFVGHPVRGKQVVPKYSYLYSFRQMGPEWLPIWRGFWKGESKTALEELILAMVENAAARRTPKTVQDHLNSLKRFWRHEAVFLANARKHTQYEQYPVPQAERDFVFLRYRFHVQDKKSFVNKSKTTTASVGRTI